VNASTQQDKWHGIRAFYAKHAEAIIAAGPNQWGIDPYAWEFEAGIAMTPIERAIWHDIRAEGAVLYPQFPVAGRFVDYGNPAARVAIECDGAQWHQDADKDRLRQAAIEREGWAVYRLTGRECAAVDNHDDDEDGRARFVPGPARLLIRMVCDRHGIRLP
jgi:hypothetical protein